LAILDYAVNEPRKVVQNLKEVTWYIGEDGEPTTDAYKLKITANIDVNDRPEALLEAPKEFDRNQIRTLLRKRGVEPGTFRELGPFQLQAADDQRPQTGELTSTDIASLIRRLASLKQKPAVEFLGFAARFDLQLEDLIRSRQGAGLGLSADEQRELARLKTNFANTTRLKSSQKRAMMNSFIDPQSVAPDWGAAELEANDGISGLDLSPGASLTPITLPSEPSRSQADDILQLRQELNTVTPIPPILAP